MLDLIKRLTNKNAIPVTKKLLEKDFSKYNLDFAPDITTTAKGVYTEMVERISGLDKQTLDKLFFLINNIEFDEQKVVNYFKSTIWNYNDVVDREIDKSLKEISDIMSKIGK